LKDAIERYVLKMKVNIKYKRNEKKRIRVVCRWKGCPWLLYASHNSRSNWFQIVTYNPNHACCPSLKIKGCIKIGYVTDMRVLSRLIHLGRLEQ